MERNATATGKTIRTMTQFLLPCGRVVDVAGILHDSWIEYTLADGRIVTAVRVPGQDVR